MRLTRLASEENQTTVKFACGLLPVGFEANLSDFPAGSAIIVSKFVGTSTLPNILPEQPGEQAASQMHSVFRLLEDNTCSTVHHFVGDFKSAFRGQVMHELY